MLVIDSSQKLCEADRLDAFKMMAAQKAASTDWGD
jgi:hypothetical protein